MIDLQPLRSRAIVAAGYDPDTRQLEIEFPSGRTYTHENVPQEVYDALVSAPSAGAYYNAAIKGRY